MIILNISNPIKTNLSDQMIVYATNRKKKGNFNNQQSLKIIAAEKLDYENIDPSNVRSIIISE